jgi:acetyltransferase-like isoleucine patch superfamily enzyme
MSCTHRSATAQIFRSRGSHASAPISTVRAFTAPARAIRRGGNGLPFLRLRHACRRYQALNTLRAERCDQARTKGYRLASWISPRAHVPKGCTVGANCFVMEGASLQPHARLGDDVFVWSGAVVGHHATIGDHAWLASNCTSRAPQGSGRTVSSG